MSSLHDRRRAECAALLETPDARAALALHGTPLLLLDVERVRSQYRRLRDALPMVRFHYAVKALGEAAVIDALHDEGCGFDVATTPELRMLQDRGVAADRCIHTHPVKTPREIAEAIDAGVRTFVVDSPGEVDKFVGAPADVDLLVRLSFRSPHAKSDLSSKFGVGTFEAGRLVEHAFARGIRVAGFSFHVGSQLDDPARFAAALTDTVALMAHLEERLGIAFRVLDIGGGFPVAYDVEVCALERIADAIRPVLQPLVGRYDLIAEPGRILAAEAMTLVTSVVGVSERADGRWCYLDDGVYGSYSNVVAEDVHPLVFAVTELGGAAAGERRWTTLAGPTCDSADVIAREAMPPELAPGDLLVSPAMGAYTAVTATRFNGRAVTPIAVIDAAPIEKAPSPVVGASVDETVSAVVA